MPLSYVAWELDGLLTRFSPDELFLRCHHLFLVRQERDVMNSENILKSIISYQTPLITSHVQ